MKRKQKDLTGNSRRTPLSSYSMDKDDFVEPTIPVLLFSFGSINIFFTSSCSFYFHSLYKGDVFVLTHFN